MWIVNAESGWLRDRLVEKCDEDVDGNEMIYNATLCNFGLNRRVWRSCTQYKILLIIVCIIIMGISGACLYF